MKSFNYSIFIVIVAISLQRTHGFFTTPVQLNLRPKINNHEQHQRQQQRHVNKMAHKDTREHYDQVNSSQNRQRFRDTMKNLAKSIIVKPMSTVDPQAIAEILTDATTGAVAVAKETIDEIKVGGSIRSSKAFSRILEEEAEMQGNTAEALDTIAL